MVLMFCLRGTNKRIAQLGDFTKTIFQSVIIQNLMRKHLYLTFSGDWLDVLGHGNAAFPPFTSEEKNVVGWIDGAASNWNFNSLPETNKEYKRDVEEYFINT